MKFLKTIIFLVSLCAGAAFVWVGPGCSDPPPPDADADVDGDSDTDVDGDSDSDADGLDSDGDGLPDSIEDINGNGIVDPGESDPNDADTDNDGLDDGSESGDSDGDGIPDVLESDTFDGDGDGTPDSADGDNTDGPCANPPKLLHWVTFDTDTTLRRDCSPYVVEGLLTIASEATLTIESGVEIRFRRGGWLLVGDGFTNGRLVAHGTAEQRIVLHSDEPGPLAGDWGGVVANMTDRLELHFVDISNAGMLGVHGDDHRGSLVVLSGTGLQLQDSRITGGQAWAVHAAPPSASWDPIFTSFLRNTMTGSDHSVAVELNRVGDIGEGNTVDHPIDVYGTMISDDAMWQDTGAAFRLVDTILQVDVGVTLQISAGVDVVVPDATLVTIDGMLRAVGTAAEPVTFGTAGGMAGTWQGLFISDSGSELRYVSIAGAGATNWYLSSVGAALTLRAMPTTTEGLVITNSSGYGVYLEAEECAGMPVSATFAGVSNCSVYCYDTWGETTCLSE